MTVSLDQALRAIQEFVDTRLPEGTLGLVIRSDKKFVSPEVTSYTQSPLQQNLGSLSFTCNPLWEEEKYESKFAKPVPKDSSVPFHERYKKGDKFKIVSLTPSVLIAGYNDEVKVGDTFEIVSLHRYDPDQPYFVTGAHTDCHPFAHNFLSALEAGAVVLSEEVPFHQKYKVGDKFKIAKELPYSFASWFDVTPKVNDILVVTSVDLEDPEQPYSVSPTYNEADYSWGRDGEFQKLVEDGYLVLVSPEPETPFHERYKVGDRFRVAKDLPEIYQARFTREVRVGDVLVITDTDPEDETMPYQVALEFNKYDYTWNGKFKQLVESGVLVYKSDNPEPTES
jgi:hypothetical protein